MVSSLQAPEPDILRPGIKAPVQETFYKFICIHIIFLSVNSVLSHNSLEKSKGEKVIYCCLPFPLSLN